MKAPADSGGGSRKTTQNGPEPGAYLDIELPGRHSPRLPERSLSPGTHNIPKDRVAAVQRERLIDAIVQVAADAGLENAGVKAVCARAGVGLATFYQHFGTKEQLCLDAYDSGVATLFDVVSEAYMTGVNTPWEGRIEAGLSALFGSLAANPAFAQFFTLEIQKAGKAAAERVDAAFDASFAMFADAPQQPATRIPPANLVPFVVGGIYTRMYFYIRNGHTDRLPELVRPCADFALAAFATTTADQISLHLTPPPPSKPIPKKSTRGNRRPKAPPRG